MTARYTRSLRLTAEFRSDRLVVTRNSRHSSKFLGSSEPQVARDTISSSLKTSQLSNVDSSLIHCSTASSSAFSEQSGWTQGRLDESNITGRVEKNAVFPHIPWPQSAFPFLEGRPDNPIPVNRESTVL
ncbi:hypothetical protein AVEN_267110-1 [Araneus ventricosus]|uniref:Uncharacterized protein n=1 Tax=Araneus ventricosus TaxID=182803 RepID=A0A4Y2T166_ARAVE|nr:hypothetical protein AVEN_251753-1 [Araneus ventricosus]GBN93247.1 hypothetical protein AVEN_267110-1 [Araneus ventricosus]